MLLNCGVGGDCWKVPWTERRSNQSIVKEISPEYSLEGLMLKLQFLPPDAKNWLIGKDSDIGKDWRQEEKGTTESEMVGWDQPARWTWVWASSGSWWWTGKPGVLQSMGWQIVGHDWETEMNRDNSKHINICIMGVPEREEWEKGFKNVFDKIMAETSWTWRRKQISTYRKHRESQTVWTLRGPHQDRS